MIGGFNGEYRWLSNFAPVKITYEGTIYPSVENAYQAQKFGGTIYESVVIHSIYSKLSSAEAKKLSRFLPVRADWSDVKLKIMEELLRRKFKNEEYRALLVETNNEELVELNVWHDTFFGKCTCPTHQCQGENHLGKLLMHIRDEIKQGRLL